MATPEDWVSPLFTGGVGATTVLVSWLLSLLTGRMHTDAEFEREVKAREAAERRADVLERTVQEKDRALIEATSRADAAVRASEVIADAFSEAKGRARGRGDTGRRRNEP